MSDVVSVVLFDQNLDQKIDLGWPGSSPGLAQVKPWAGPGSSPGLGQGQALGKLARKITKIILMKNPPSSDPLMEESGRLDSTV